MFAKIHEQILNSSIMEAEIETRYTWMCLLVLADKDGVVDMTIPSIARRINIPVKAVESAIKVFMEPDATSRTDREDGRRLTPIRDSFGWHITNYQQYRDLRNQEERREQNRIHSKNYRDNKKIESASATVSNRQQSSAKSANTDADAEADANTDKDLKTLCVFDQFWAAYPIKKNKRAALKAWKKIKMSATLLDIILNALSTQKGSAQWQRGVIPHASTWLNNMRWEDEPETGFVGQDRYLNAMLPPEGK